MDYDDMHWAELLRTVAGRISIEDFTYLSARAWGEVWGQPLEVASAELARRYAGYSNALHAAVAYAARESKAP